MCKIILELLISLRIENSNTWPSLKPVYTYMFQNESNETEYNATFPELSFWKTQTCNKHKTLGKNWL